MTQLKTKIALNVRETQHFIVPASLKMRTCH